MKEKPSSEIEILLQHKFSQPDLLRRALTHRSLAYERRLAAYEKRLAADEKRLAGNEGSVSDDPADDNEQLEFLGDAVVGFLVAEDLCRRNPELNEGELTRLRAELVSRRHLAEVAARLHIGDHMLLGRGEERSGGRRKAALLANCIEAVMAAIYLDGGIDAARGFILREVVEPAAPGLLDQMRAAAPIGDYKSALQEILQSRNHSQPEYAVKAESGPDHRKRFLVEVYVRENGARENGAQGRALARGIGGTKKKAEQEAARRAIAKLRSAGGARA